MDNDGWPDLLIVNGHVYPEVDTAHLGSTYKEPRLVYWNQGNGKFKDISRNAGPGCTEPKSSRGMAIADFWNDGRVSAVINNSGAKPMLLVNVAANPQSLAWDYRRGHEIQPRWHWGGVSVSAGGRNWVQEVRSGSSYISSNDLRLHFGLGKATKIDRVEIDWPSGRKESFRVPSVDHNVTLTEGTGQALTKP